jgi:hypothetical protein
MGFITPNVFQLDVDFTHETVPFLSENQERTIVGAVKDVIEGLGFDYQAAHIGPCEGDE